MASLKRLCEKYQVSYNTLYSILYRRMKQGDESVLAWQRIREWDVPEELVQEYARLRDEQSTSRLDSGKRRAFVVMQRKENKWLI